MDRPAHRARVGAALVRAAATDPQAPVVDPVPQDPDRGTHPRGAAHRQAAPRRRGEAVQRGQRPAGQVWPGHARRAGRRGA